MKQIRKIPYNNCRQMDSTQNERAFLRETNLQSLQKLFLEFLTHTKKLSPHSLRAYKKDLESLLNEKEAAQLLKERSHQKSFKKQSEAKSLNKARLNQKKPANFGQKNFKPKDSQIKSIKAELEQKNLSSRTSPVRSTRVIQNPKELERQIKYLVQENISQNRSWKNSTRSRKLASVRAFIKWLSEEKYLKEDFRHLFKSPKTSNSIPFFLSVDETLLIIDLFQKKNSISAEDKALFFLIYGGGLRVSEACRLKSKDIDWSHKTLKITGKGGRQRLVFLPEYAFSFLSKIQSPYTYFFGQKPLSERKAYDKIKKIGRLAGFSKNLHPHALRHSFATHMLTGGSEIRVLQELLGHKSLKATQKYTHLDLAYLDKTLENFHPLNKDLKLLDK